MAICVESGSLVGIKGIPSDSGLAAKTTFGGHRWPAQFVGSRKYRSGPISAEVNWRGVSATEIVVTALGIFQSPGRLLIYRSHWAF